MIVYPKKDIKNVFGQIFAIKDEPYECIKIEDDLYILKCILIGNEYPMISEDEINRSFYTKEQRRDSAIENIIK